MAQRVSNRCKDLFKRKKYFGVRCTLICRFLLRIRTFIRFLLAITLRSRNTTTESGHATVPQQNQPTAAQLLFNMQATK